MTTAPSIAGRLFRCFTAAAVALMTAMPAQAADTVVRIGNIIPLSGPSATVGQQGKNAREMAVAEINAAGG